MSFFCGGDVVGFGALALDLISRLFASMRPSGQLDLVSNVLCQGVAFLVTLFFWSSFTIAIALYPTRSACGA
jgi:hypothetical protein